MDKPFFSVLMPVYNSQNTVKRAVDSVLAQRFQDFELILVDDCSTDGSGKILAEYVEQNSKIKVVRTQRNLGVANARNEGIKLVQGQYLTFVDADDYIEPELFAKVRDVIERTGAQLVKYSVVEEYYDKNSRYLGNKNVQLSNKLYTTAAEVRKAVLPMEQLPLFGYLWNGFYSLETVPKYLWDFDTQWRVNEDFRMNMKLIEHINRMACMSYIGYHYKKQENASLSTRDNQQYYELTKIKIQLLLDSYKKWGFLTSGIENTIYWLYIRIVYSAVCRVLLQSTRKAARLELEKVYGDTLFQRFLSENENACYASKKQNVMYRWLYGQHTEKILFLCTAINLVKKHFQVIFAKIKG